MAVKQTQARLSQAGLSQARRSPALGIVRGTRARTRIGPAAGWLHDHGLLYAAIVLGVALVATLRHPLPAGMAGLYSLMADRIARDGFALPERVPWYGPGGIPFAYPPIALYVMALCTHLLHVPLMTYLRIEPPLVTALVVLPLAALYQDLLGSRQAALLAAGLAVTTPVVLTDDMFADGSVRSIALLFTATALCLTWRALERRSRGHAAWAALCLAGTLATHVENGLFACLALVSMSVCYRPSTARVLWGAAIGLGALIASSPWWMRILARFGPGVFVAMAHSHGSGGLLSVHSATGALAVVADAVYRLWLQDPGTDALTALGLVGIVLSRARWGMMLPAWMVLSMLFLLEAQRCIAIVLALGTVVCLQRLTSRAVTMPTGRKPLFAGIALLLLTFGVARVTFTLGRIQPALTAADIRSALWIRSHTPAMARVLPASVSEWQAEWYPYLDHRSPTLGPWGAEWLGTYDRQRALFYRVAVCTRLHAVACVLKVARDSGSRVDVLVLSGRWPIAALRAAGWSRPFSTASTTVWIAPVRHADR